MEQTVTLEPDKFYHIYTRGNNKESIFKSSQNYIYFLQLYRKYITPYADTFAYCLLPNHVHFLIRVKEAEALSVISTVKVNSVKVISVQRQLAHLLNAYAKAINVMYKRTDGLFQQRFKRKEVNSTSYFTRLIFYIHVNPQHHGLLENFSDWPYSSYHSFLSDSKTALEREQVLEWFGGKEWYIKFHKEQQEDFKLIAPLVAEDDI